MGFDEDQFFFSAQWDFSFRYFFKWANPGLFFVYFRSFQKQNFQKILYASAGFELGSSEQKASTLTT